MKLAVFFAVICAPLGARAASTAISVDGQSTCPELDRVAARLQEIYPDAEVGVALSNPDAARVIVTNDANSTNVQLGAQTMQIDPRVSNCQARAAAVAVFVISIIKPPDIADPLPKPIVEQTAIATEPAPPRWRAQVEVAGEFLGAPQVGQSRPLTGGFSVRGWIGGRYIGASAGIAFFAPMGLSFPSASADFWRIPWDVSLRIQGQPGKFTLAADMGFLATLVAVNGNKVAGFDTELASTVKFEPGIRFAALAAWWLKPWIAPYLALQFHYVPAPLGLSSYIVGDLGSLPSFWGGVSLGVAFRVYPKGRK